MVGSTTFRFLNRSHSIDRPEDWANLQWDKLWLYHLHYFDDLAAVGWQDRTEWHRSILARWIAANPDGVGWEPYCLSRRIVNWIRWALAGNDLGSAAQVSLGLQARYLQKRIEWHLLGNHLLANATALVFAGCFFGGPEADRWRAKGLAILGSELPEQLLADGGHFELSPMYHAIVLTDLLDLINLARAYPGIIPRNVVEGWIERAGAMRSWLATMCHPDGHIAFFNDAAFGASATLSEIEAYARRLNLPDAKTPARLVTHLRQSGYLRLDSGPMVAILDIANVGPKYQPGHAHADTLSFELSLYGQRILVNSGTSCYGEVPARASQRATAAHNTLEINEQNSSEVWGSFRVARRARPFDLQLTESNGTVHISCAHDGYRRLPGRVVHRRQWEYHGRALRIIDRLEGGYHSAVARYHVHPDVSVEQDGQAGRLVLPDGRKIAWCVEDGSADIAPSSFHPEFGLSFANSCIEIRMTKPHVITTFGWC